MREAQGSTHLTGCRAYEQVSPVDKSGYDAGLLLSAGVDSVSVLTEGITVASADMQAAPDGNSAVFGAIGGFAGIRSSAAGSNKYFSQRTASGWTTRGISPPHDNTIAGISLTDYPVLYGFTNDLSHSIARVPPRQPIDPAADLTQSNLFRRTEASDTFTLMTPILELGAGGADQYGAGSSDLTKITTVAAKQLVPGTIGGRRAVYRSSLDASGNAHVELVSVLPNGQPSTEESSVGNMLDSAFNRSYYQTDRTISPDGARIVWFEGTGPITQGTCSWSAPMALPYQCDTRLYLWQEGRPTRAISAVTPGTTPSPSPGPGELFWQADAQTERIFFTAQRNLTPDANADKAVTMSGGSYGDLYRYDATANGGSGGLVDVTPDPSSARGARVLGVLGISDDGQRVYFVARSNRLDGTQGVDGKANLYLWDGSGATPTTTFIATLEPLTSAALKDTENWFTNSYARSATVTPDGRQLIFTTTRNVTSFDSEGRRQVYRYDATAAGDPLTCVSCPSHGPATAPAHLPAGRPSFIDHQARALTDDGRTVFFETAEPLVPEDANGRIDVYAYDAASGAQTLVSSGNGANDSFFQDATPDGSDVFFTTRDRLVGWDDDANVDLYDARRDGGFAEPSTPVTCNGSGCQGAPPAPPLLPAAASVDFSGDGNVPAPPRPVRVSASKAVRGWSANVVVRTPAAGTIRVTGTGIRSQRRTAARAQSAALTVQLTPASRRTLLVRERRAAATWRSLQRRHRLTARARRTLAARATLRVRVRVTFTPRGGEATVHTVAIAFRAPQQATHDSKEVAR